MERLIFLSVFTIIALLLDIYFYQVIKKYKNIKWNKFLFGIYWFFSLTTLINFFVYLIDVELDYYYSIILFNFIIGNFISKLLALPFILLDDLRRLLIFLFWYNKKRNFGAGGITRSKFLSLSASIAYGFPLTSLTYGIISNNVYDYRVRRRNVYFNKLPKSFDGIKICHISDIHIGSLRNRFAAIGGIDMIVKESADMIFFTGDIVNNKASELKGWGDQLSRIKAPLGVFSVLGNHDYGEYTSWRNESEKLKNFKDIIAAHKEFGWNLLMNQNNKVIVDGEIINILGVENWAASRFQQYGKIDIAYKGLEKENFKLLLSHNPSHWNEQITTQYSDIDLTLSGHTHGLQYGIEIGNIKWSPAKLAYKQWADLYKNNNQQIYVNRGYGFLGYQGRVGILPEITILNLKRV